MRTPVLPIALLCGLLAGCSRHATAPAPASPGANAPRLIATEPPARSTSAQYDSEIWAQFDRPLDVRTVDTLTVFLKLDGQRVPDSVSYDAITRRIFVHPRVTLQLRRTYTVDLSPGVKGADGTPLPEGLYFQFTTNSLRRVVYDYPAVDSLEGPLATLGWGGSGTLDGNLFYEVYASTDSLAVALRTAPILQRTVFRRYVPAVPWPLGSRVYWAVTTENVATHERQDAPLRSFDTVPPATPVDSVVIPAKDYGSSQVRFATQYCAAQTLPCGPSFNAAVHWDYTRVPGSARLAGVSVQVCFTSPNAGSWNATRPELWQSQGDWSACAMVAPGPPYPENTGFLSGSSPVDSVRVEFGAPRLGAFIEALVRRRTMLTGTLLRSLQNTVFESPATLDRPKAPRVVVRYYRLPASLPAPLSAGSRRPGPPRTAKAS